MTSTKNIKTGKPQLSVGWKSLGIVAIVMTLIGQTSCVSNLPPNVSDLNIFQPSTLRLIKSEAIQTRDGIYTPQTDEVWHSDARYRRLEREFYHGSGNK
jgi:hypothetical protein